LNKEFYDSNDTQNSLLSISSELFRYKELVVLLVRNEMKVRYKRSLLGLAWTLINPLITSIILWFVFISIFSARLPGEIEFAPYVFSGILLITFFSQGFNQAAESIEANVSILLKIYIPPQIFAFSAAIANAINFIFGLFALGIVSVVTGDGVSPYFLLTLVLVFALTLLITGTGLLASIAYVRYSDFRNIIGIAIMLLMYISPVFYPKEILSPTMQNLVELNPLTSFLDVFRDVFLGTSSSNTFDWIYLLGISLVIFALGTRLFARVWPRTIVML
jgi:ABC-type polysaccharide/polyol phosphate export permease